MLVQESPDERELFRETPGEDGDFVEGARFAATLGFLGEAGHASGAEVSASALEGVRDE